MAFIFAGHALAQTAPDATSGAKDEPAAAGEVSEVVVTGSRISTPNLTSSSPVAVVSSKDIQLSGATRIEDLLNSLPSVLPDQGAGVSNGSDGTANLNLRGLGCQRTLVLVDGRRLLPGSPSNPCADLNNVPTELIDRVEVLTGGASAVYGADAVAGVVNFVTKKNYQGVHIDSTVSFYQHDNNNNYLQSVNAAAGYDAPSGSDVNGITKEVNLMIGVNSPDGKGNATVYLNYRDVNKVTEDKYDYSNCSLSGTHGNYACGGSSTSATGAFYLYSSDFSTYYGKETVDGTSLRDFTSGDLYNYAPANYYQRPDERYMFGANAHYELDKSADIYTQLMFMDDRSIAQIAPSGVFGVTASVSCSNPLLSAQEVGTLCTNQGLTAADSSTVLVLRRDVEGEPRQDDLQHTAYRGVVGVRGDLGAAWKYDVYGMFSRTEFSERYTGEFSISRTLKALDVVTNPATGEAVCASYLDGTDTSCVPYNIWTAGGVTQAALDYLTVSGFQKGSTEESVVSASLTGNLGEYGIKSPWASDGVSVAGGGEYRREALDLNTDLEFSTGDLAGQGGATNSVSGSYDVWELFGETHVPIIQDKPLFQNLSFDGAYRLSEYKTSADTSFTTRTFKAGGEWAPIRDFSLRGGFNRAVRAPNISELFTAQSVSLDGATDGCAGSSPTYTLAECENTGVTATQYGNIAENSASQYNGLQGGNPDLKPEKSDTFTIGAVVTPRFLRAFNISVDYFDIKIKNVIQQYGADYILDQCATTGNSAFCNLVHRNSAGSLWQNTDGYIIDTLQNTGSLKTTGIDVQANYGFGFAELGWKDMGRLTFSLMGTWTDTYAVQTLTGGSTYDCVGKYGNTCGVPRPDWKHKFRTTWSTPWKVDLSAQWRYIGKTKDDDPDAGLDGIKAYNYFDLAADWTVRDGIHMRVGVNNVFDKDPPIISNDVSSVYVNGNTYTQVYDALGRYMFFSVSADF